MNTQLFGVRSSKLLALTFVFGLLYGCQKNTPFTPPVQQESSGVVIDWYKLQLRILLNANPVTNNATNFSNFGYVGVGLYEAVHPGIKGSVSLSTQLNQMPAMPAADKIKDYLWTASANAALASMVRSFYVGLTDANKASIDSLENAYNQGLRTSTSDAVFNRSQAFGRAVAAAVYDWSKSDNFNASNTGYIPPVYPGAWEPTPPAFAGAAAPFIKDARLFLGSNQTVTAPPLPFPYSQDPSSDFYKMVKDLYDVSKTLTSEQQNMAQWWADVGVGRGYTPPGHHISIVTQVLDRMNADLARAAIVYAKVGVAMHDGVIMCWKMKYQYNVLRPVTYIRKLIDPTWLPLISTPAHPEYPAAHAYFTNAVMEVLTRELGDNVPVTDNTYTFLGFAPRQYASFRAVAEESAISRFYGGIHYKPSIAVGLALGKQIGSKAADINLAPSKY